jgi:hypothetical protein
LLLARTNDARGNLPRCVQLAILLEHTSQRVGIVAIHYVSRRATATLVHTHIERRLATERETSFGSVEVVRRYSQVGQNGIDLAHSAQAQGRTQKTEVALDIVEALVVGGIGQRITILVKGEESSTLAQPRAVSTPKGSPVQPWPISWN